MGDHGVSSLARVDSRRHQCFALEPSFCWDSMCRAGSKPPFLSPLLQEEPKARTGIPQIQVAVAAQPGTPNASADKWPSISRSSGTASGGDRPPEPGFCSLQLELYFAMVFKTFTSCSIFLGRFMLMFLPTTIFFKMEAHISPPCHYCTHHPVPARDCLPGAISYTLLACSLPFSPCKVLGAQLCYHSPITGTPNLA